MLSSLKTRTSRDKPQTHHPTSQKIDRSIIASFYNRGHKQDTNVAVHTANALAKFSEVNHK
jgi:hypothetical protein